MRTLAVRTRASVFLDTNVLLYLLSADPAKADAAEALLAKRPTISVQVLNEVASVCSRKLRMSWDEIGRFLELVQGFCRVVPVTLEIHRQARELAERYRLSFYDACIAAAALVAGCSTLHSEDMHSGLLLDGRLRVLNPFG